MGGGELLDMQGKRSIDRKGAGEFVSQVECIEREEETGTDGIGPSKQWI